MFVYKFGREIKGEVGDLGGEKGLEVLEAEGGWEVGVLEYEAIFLLIILMVIIVFCLSLNHIQSNPLFSYLFVASIGTERYVRSDFGSFYLFVDSHFFFSSFGEFLLY